VNPAGDAVAAGAPEAQDREHHGFLQAVQSLLTVIVVALFILTFTVQPFRIPSESMVPTLLVGDFLLVDKDVSGASVFAPENRIRRGDLVVFYFPVDPAKQLVKRVVGLPGERIRLREGRVFVDGAALAEPYAIYETSAPDGYRDNFPRMSSTAPGVDSRWWAQMRTLVANGEITVPADSYFVLGDNRNNSEDSRYWGFVPAGAVVGKPLVIYFSLNGSGDGGAWRVAPLGALAHFARWNRALQVIH
jgi:signal peptidase I